MAKAEFAGQLEKIGCNCWRIPKEYKAGMRVDGHIFANDKLIDTALGEVTSRHADDLCVVRSMYTFNPTHTPAAIRATASKNAWARVFAAGGRRQTMHGLRGA
jgi:hypothetical protein